MTARQAVLLAILTFAAGAVPAHAQASFPPLKPGAFFQDCDAPGASPDICRVKQPLTSELVEQRLQGKTLAWWRHEDLFTVVARNTGNDVRLSGAINAPLAQLQGTDLWVLTMKIPRLDQAVIDMIVTPSGPRTGDMPEWRGVAAEPAPLLINTLRGKLITETLESKHLGEPRRLTIYLPEHFDPSATYPVAYFADGRGVGLFAHLIEPAIREGRVRPIVMVGVHSGDDDKRSREYLRGWRGSEQDTALRHPAMFGAAAAVSLGWDSSGEIIERADRPRILLATGLLDAFILQTRKTAARAALSVKGVTLITPVSGHGPAMQELLLDDILIWAFGAPSHGAEHNPGSQPAASSAGALSTLDRNRSATTPAK